MHFHPLHPALVHFPITCWVLAVPCDLAGWLYFPQAWYAAYLLILGGVILAVPAMLAGMPARVREAFLMSQLDGMSYAEIAARLGVTVSSVQKYMSRALVACYRIAYA